MQSPIVRGMYTVPLEVAKIHEPDAKYYTALRLAMANRHIGLIMTANPSTLVHLGKMIDREQERLIRDIHDGTLAVAASLPEGVRRTLVRRCKANRSRAKELEAILQGTGRLAPCDFWPELALTAVWTGGSAGAYLANMRRYFGDVSVRDHGLSASEGRMTIPFMDGRADGHLDVGTHFFEFIPEEEYDSASPTVLEAHELEEGANYYILLTTTSGLYRYNIRDVVHCTGFYGTTPRLEFLHKGAHIANLTGEKISESQVVDAVRGTLHRLRMELSYFTVSPVWDELPYYRLHFESHDLPHPALARQLVTAVDQSLRDLNCEYAEKRATGRLGELVAQPLPEGTWRRYQLSRQSRLGGSVEQYKHPCLSPDLQFSETLLQRFAQEAGRALEQPAA
jgi:hypothetical protein